MEDRAGYLRAKFIDDLLVFKADMVRFSFKRHAHDYFAVGMIEDGVQSFSCARLRGCLTPPRGLFAINPGDAHTGESAFSSGLRYRAIYPSAERMRAVASELGRKTPRLPDFAQPVIEDDRLFIELRNLLAAIERSAPALAQESLYMGFLAKLISRHADDTLREASPGKEQGPLARAKAYIEANYRDEVRLDDLSRESGLSPFYLIRAFRAQVGMPPHAYLETVRVREAQRRLRTCKSLAGLAYEVGFSSQSHLTSTFKAIIGVPPGTYARAIS